MVMKLFSYRAQSEQLLHSVQVLLQLDDLTIFTPKGHTPLVEQITLQVKAGTIPSAKLIDGLDWC